MHQGLFVTTATVAQLEFSNPAENECFFSPLAVLCATPLAPLRVFKSSCFRREGSSWSLPPTQIVMEEKPREVTAQSAISSGLPTAIEIHILEESRETMRVGELGRRVWTRNFVWLRCGLIHKPKNVATISYALSSQRCDGGDLRKENRGSCISSLLNC